MAEAQRGASTGNGVKAGEHGGCTWWPHSWAMTQRPVHTTPWSHQYAGQSAYCRAAITAHESICRARFACCDACISGAKDLESACGPAGAEGIKVLKQYRPAAMARSQKRYFDDVSSDRSQQCAGIAFRRLPTVNGGEAVGTRLNSCATMGDRLGPPISGLGSKILPRYVLRTRRTRGLFGDGFGRVLGLQRCLRLLHRPGVDDGAEQRRTHEGSVGNKVIQPAAEALASEAMDQHGERKCL